MVDCVQKRSERHIPSGDLCDFLSCSVTDLIRILQGTALFSWGNDEFLEEACNGEVPKILQGLETRFSSEKAQLSILFEAGSWLGCSKFLEEACNGEVPKILPGFETRFSSEMVQRSILFKSGSYSRCSVILVEACNGEVIKNLTRFLTRLHHDPFRFFTEERRNLLRILMGSES